MTASGDDEDRATAEAARWVVALEDDPSDRDMRARFEAWLAACPANAAAWANTCDIYDMMGKVPPTKAGHWMGAARSPGAGMRWRRIAGGIAAAALAACLAFAAGPTFLLRMQADQSTSTAELRSIRLTDGSAVRLGADSAIAIAFSGGERGVCRGTDGAWTERGAISRGSRARGAAPSDPDPSAPRGRRARRPRRS